MSWLARSIANSLLLDEEDDAVRRSNPDDAVRRSSPDEAVSPGNQSHDSTIVIEDNRSSNSEENDGYNSNHDDDEDPDRNNQGRGVREDLSEFTDTLTRQFWGVASFLAPPPPPPPPPPPIRRQLVVLKSESKSECPVSGNDGFDCDDDGELVGYNERESDKSAEFENLSQSEGYNEYNAEDAIGITEEVLAFARNIAHHPETWLDFPLSEENEFDDFDISDAQYQHILAVEHLAPRLAALRIELCPAHMSESYFWTVYFVLLDSRLNKHDADLLSSKQIVQARAMWMQELRKQMKDESYWLERSTFQSKESADSKQENIMHSYEDAHYRMFPFEQSTPHTTNDQEIDKHPVEDIKYIDKSVIKEDPAPKPHEKEIFVGPSYQIPVQNYDDDDDDDWLKEDSDLIGYSSTTIMINEEDVSFSDLEDDIDCTMPVKSKIISTEWCESTNSS